MISCKWFNNIKVFFDLNGCSGTRTYNHLFHKWTLNLLAKLALNDWAVLWGIICMMHLTACSYHAMHMFGSNSTLYSCLNVKELLARSRCNIWNLSDCNRTWSHNHLVCKLTLNHLAKLALVKLAMWHDKNIQSVILWWIRFYFYHHSFHTQYNCHYKNDLLLLVCNILLLSQKGNLISLIILSLVWFFIQERYIFNYCVNYFCF